VAAALGLSLQPHTRAGHIVGLQLPGGSAADVVERLADAHVHVSLRGDTVRVSPHVYNTADDVSRLIDVLAAAV
jgi:selenocysteine lyase/cysteine desulfurase